jgi:phasin protein
MSHTDENKPKVRSDQRKAKPKQRSKTAERRSAPDPQQDHRDQLQAPVAFDEVLPVASDALPEPADIEPAAASQPRTEGALVPVGSPVAIDGPVQTFWIGYDALTQAYRACAWRSLEESMSLVEKLTFARSLEKTVEIHHEYTRRTYDGFMEESQNMRRLYRELSSQMFRSFELLLVWRRPAAR